MRRGHPEEYITLPSAEQDNYSEVYDKRYFYIPSTGQGKNRILVCYWCASGRCQLIIPIMCVVFDRLMNPHSCPAGGSRQVECLQCRPTPYTRAGITTFSRVRLNITSFHIISEYTSRDKMLNAKQRLVAHDGKHRGSRSWSNVHGCVMGTDQFSLFQSNFTVRQ